MRQETMAFMIWKSCTPFIHSHLNIKGHNSPHISEPSSEEFGVAENLVIGKINNIYSAEMQISFHRGSMNN
jgi:hypothetical protein